MRRPLALQMFRSLPTLIFAVLLSLHMGRPHAMGQLLRKEPTPFSVWLDFRKISAGGGARQALPIWLQSVQRDLLPPDNAALGTTIFRLHFRPLHQLNEQIQLRLFFADHPGRTPTITGWSETGEQRFVAPPLGNGLGLPTSESLIIGLREINYLEIAVPGDGSNLRGAFLTTLKKIERQHALDFEPLTAIDDPFENRPPARASVDDAYLYGRVKATLDRGTARLAPGAAPLVYEFELETRPLLAVVTFEILNVDPANTPALFINQHPLGEVTVSLPDLADPAFEGSRRPLEQDMQFRYAGWLRCQKLIRGSFLEPGVNILEIRASHDSAAVAVRVGRDSTETQLAQPSLQPASLIRMKPLLHSRSAFTLLEIMLVVLIIALLMGAAIYVMGDNLIDAQKARAQADIRAIGTQLTVYQAQNGFLPTTEQGLQALVSKPETEPKPRSWRQYMKEVPEDSWKLPYFYVQPGRHNPDSYDLFSAGKDRKPDTADDIGNWKQTGT